MLIIEINRLVKRAFDVAGRERSSRCGDSSGDENMLLQIGLIFVKDTRGTGIKRLSIHSDDGLNTKGSVLLYINSQTNLIFPLHYNNYVSV